MCHKREDKADRSQIPEKAPSSKQEQKTEGLSRIKMINLSERLLAIAQEVGKGETVADIGTDHGFLPLYLWEKGISPKVIMTDISQGFSGKSQRKLQQMVSGHRI